MMIASLTRVRLLRRRGPVFRGAETDERAREWIQRRGLLALLRRPLPSSRDCKEVLELIRQAAPQLARRIDEIDGRIDALLRRRSCIEKWSLMRGLPFISTRLMASFAELRAELRRDLRELLKEGLEFGSGEWVGSESVLDFLDEPLNASGASEQPSAA